MDNEQPKTKECNLCELTCIDVSPKPCKYCGKIKPPCRFCDCKEGKRKWKEYWEWTESMARI